MVAPDAVCRACTACVVGMEDFAHASGNVAVGSEEFRNGGEVAADIAKVREPDCNDVITLERARQALELTLNAGEQGGGKVGVRWGFSKRTNPRPAWHLGNVRSGWKSALGSKLLAALGPSGGRGLCRSIYPSLA